MFRNNIRNRNVKNENRITIVLLVLLLISIALMRYFDSFLITEVSKNGIVSFELAKDISSSVQIMNAWDNIAKSAAGLSLGFDFFFLIIYASFLAMLMFKVSNQQFKKSNYHHLKNIIIISPFIAAFFDVLENIALIKLLLGDLQQIWSTMAYYFAIVKFGLLIIIISYIVIGSVLFLIKRK
ncbi:MAG: hypothetical protein ABFR32_09240 [Bacteroidota bacterium]